MSSRDSSSSRDTVVHCLSQKPGRTFSATPIINQESAESSVMTQGSNGHLPTIQERRGRRDITNNGYRPLSVFTKSMLIPFDQNFDAAFEALQSDSSDRLAIAKSILSTESANSSIGTSGETIGDRTNIHRDSCEGRLGGSASVDSQDYQPQRQESKKETTTPERSLLTLTMSQQYAIRDCDMDIMTALKETSPEKDATARVSGDFTTLCDLPVPDPSEHPAFASNAFEARSEAPLISTPTSADAIRALCLRKHRNHEEHSSVGRQSIERKRSLFGLGLSTPAAAKSRNGLRSSEDSSFPILIPTPNTKSARSSSSTKNTSPTTTDFTQSRESTSIDRNSGVRKLSDLFRRKDSMEKSSSPSSASSVWSPRMSGGTPNSERQDLEKYLRRTTFTPTFDFDPYSSYPRHPNTGRGWKSRNLKCTTCSAAGCAVCHRVCCAYRAAVLALDNHKAGSPGQPVALQRIQEITKLFPYGKESPTFLQCTAGAIGDNMGCGMMVCPDCCSICPDEACADTVCRRCKPMMWADCDWHKDGMIINGY